MKRKAIRVVVKVVVKKNSQLKFIKRSNLKKSLVSSKMKILNAKIVDKRLFSLLARKNSMLKKDLIINQ